MVLHLIAASEEYETSYKEIVTCNVEGLVVLCSVQENGG